MRPEDRYEIDDGGRIRFSEFDSRRVAAWVKEKLEEEERLMNGRKPWLGEALQMAFEHSATKQDALPDTPISVHGNRPRNSCHDEINMVEEPSKRTVTTAEAAALLGLSGRRIRQMCDDGSLRGRKTPGARGVWLIDADQLPDPE